jgi:pyridoxamine 5'-phosphate oxidase
MDGDSISALLRGLPSLAGPFPPFDPTTAPVEPAALFVDWLVAAVAAGVPEPHAATLATVDRSGRPSARVLIVKNVDLDGWQFASSAAGRKGRELAETPSAALTFYWPGMGRQVRVRGAVRSAAAAASAADFRERSPAARAVGLTGRQSEPLGDRAELDAALAAATRRLAAEPDLVAPGWTLYTLRPDEVEFWQGDRQRRHTRLRYGSVGDGWTRELLWP